MVWTTFLPMLSICLSIYHGHRIIYPVSPGRLNMHQSQGPIFPNSLLYSRRFRRLLSRTWSLRACEWPGGGRFPFELASRSSPSTTLTSPSKQPGIARIGLCRLVWSRTRCCGSCEVQTFLSLLSPESLADSLPSGSVGILWAAQSMHHLVRCSQGDGGIR